MNIFVLDDSPETSAKYMCDKHINKMVVESAQMLCTAHRMLDGIETKRASVSGKRFLTYFEMPEPDESLLYRAAHLKHPCNIWIRETEGNYHWLYDHFMYLGEEYTYRYGKVHMTDTKLRQALKQVPTNIPDIGPTKFKLAMGSNPECIFEDAVKSYRAFYHTKEERFNLVWTKRMIPDWWQGQRLA